MYFRDKEYWLITLSSLKPGEIAWKLIDNKFAFGEEEWISAKYSQIEGIPTYLILEVQYLQVGRKNPNPPVWTNPNSMQIYSVSR